MSVRSPRSAAAGLAQVVPRVDRLRSPVGSRTLKAEWSEHSVVSLVPAVCYSPLHPAVEQGPPDTEGQAEDELQRRHVVPACGSPPALVSPPDTESVEVCLRRVVAPRPLFSQMAAIERKSRHDIFFT